MKHKKWQYMSIYYSHSHVEGDALNKFGAKGWELVSTHATEDGSSYYFKREVES